MSFYASYYRCALQMNPYCYSRFRGNEIKDENEYNEAILQKCIDNNIAVVGLANHGNVDDSESLRKKLSESKIVVFPGFEIMSAEKIHMVCLFPSDRSQSELNRYLGAMGLDTVVEGTETSSMTCLQIADKVLGLGGFWYAAHITSDNGILKLGKLNTIWQSEMLIAAQIPDSKENVDPRFKNIINNNDPQYAREHAPAYINACDIENPNDLDKETSTTLIKMSEPNFQNFLDAFKDPESRIRLNSEVECGYQSALKTIQVFGGYLDGFSVELSDNLNTIIGGRGTGKSTIINIIRYALDLAPDEKLRRNEFDEMLNNNLGPTSRIELTVVSNARFGQQFKIIRRFGSDPVIEDSNGAVSQLKVKDILPNIEIYGQNEIMDAVHNSQLIAKIISRLITPNLAIQNALTSAYKNLSANGNEILTIEEAAANDEEEIADLPALQERLQFYVEAGLDDKLGLIKRITSEETEFESFSQKIPSKTTVLSTIKYPEGSEPTNIHLKGLLERYNEEIIRINKQYTDLVEWLLGQYSLVRTNWEVERTTRDEEIRTSLNGIEGIQDKSSSDIVADYTEVLKKVKKAEPIQLGIDARKQKLDKLLQERKTLIEACRKAWDRYAEDVCKQLKSLNKKKLNNVLRLSVLFKQEKQPILSRLKSINGIGDKSILGIEQFENFDVFDFVDDIRKGEEHLRTKYSLTATTAERIVLSLSEKDLRYFEELVLQDKYSVELFVNGKFKRIENLSKGQQCTAILHILLLENKDTLIVDQPEDNLDNSFIADTLIAVLRDNKIRRQYIFATHNANIPVFGDAELIIAMDEIEGRGIVCDGGIGSVDTPEVKKQVVHILEGGESAFKMRRAKYGI